MTSLKMSSLRTMSYLVLLGATLILFQTQAKADAWNKRTIVTTRESIEVPGNVVLPPGKYVFKLFNSISSRHIVQVMNDREDKLMAMVMAIPAQRMKPADKTILTFYETPKSEPPFIRSWFYPGDTYGQEFAYPRNRALHISQLTGVNVPIDTSTSTTDVSSTDVSQAELPGDTAAATPPPEPAEQQVSSLPPTQEQPAEEPVLLAQNNPPPAQPSTTPAAPAETPTKLPDTASQDPLLLLAGMAAIGSGFVLRRLSTIRIRRD